MNAAQRTDATMRRRFFSAVCLIVAFGTPILAHPNSVSYAQFTIDRAAIRAVVRLPLDDVDLLLRLDRNLDEQVSRAELENSREAIQRYVSAHLHVTVDGAPIAETVERIDLWRDASGFQYVETDLVSAVTAPGTLAIRSDFLTDLYPSHTTLGRITANGREDRFTFSPAAVYERRVGSDRFAAWVALTIGVMALGTLWLARRRRTAAMAVAAMLVASAASADVVMTAGGLNSTLKTMEKLQQRAVGGPGAARAEALFQLGAEADALAALMNQEVESHGMQERELLDLALSRTKELGVGIAYNRSKKKFFYDGAAFTEYLSASPRGEHAAAAEFKLLSYAFYLSEATDVAALASAADTKKRFLARYPRFDGNIELRLYLAVDYRDLYRRYTDARDAANASKYRQLARAECQRIAKLYPHTEQADAATQLAASLK